MKVVFLLIILSIIGLASSDDNCYPETVYMTLGEYYSPDYSETSCTNTLQISFSTVNQCSDSYVIVLPEINEAATAGHFNSQNFLQQTAQPILGKKQSVVEQSWNGEKFCHNGKNCEKVYYQKFVHYFTFDLCSFKKRFTYKIYGNIDESPRVFTGILPKRDRSSDEIQQFLAFGDHEISVPGNYTISSLTQLIQENKEYDGILFLGDYAYEFYNNNATKGDIYMNSMEPFYSYWPYMFSPGNHEDCYNFAFANQKFHMMNNISQQNNNVFSFNIGKVHFLSVNLHYFNNGTGVIDPQIQESMLQSVEKDLITANLNRKSQPWIFILGHKPIYCVGRSDCYDYYVQYQQFDKLFFKYGVDIFLAAHQHETTKYYPMYQNDTMPYQQFKQNIILNPKSYMQILQGNAGCNDMGPTDQYYNATWILSRSFDPGFGTLQIINDNLIQFLNYDSQTNSSLEYTMIYSDHSYHINNNNIDYGLYVNI
ncbi:hypothetical protein ABPG72_016323 [Tetrahymena utriculariae]